MKRILPILILLGIAAGALAVNPYLMVIARKNAAGGGIGVSKTSLVAWYDFTSDGSNEHSASHDLQVTGSPTYTGGYAECNDSPAAGFFDNATTALGSNFGTSTGTSCSVAIRWQGFDSFDTGDYAFNWKFTRWYVRGRVVGSGGNIAAALNVFDTDGSSSYVDDTWYCSVVVYDASAGTVEHFHNAASNGSSTGTEEAGTQNTGFLPGSSASHDDMRVDWFGVWNRALSAEEVTNLYNGGSTVTYADLND